MKYSSIKMIICKVYGNIYLMILYGKTIQEFQFVNISILHYFLEDSSKIKEEIKNEIKEEPSNNEDELSVMEEQKPQIQNCYKEENSTDDDDEERLVIKDEPNSQDEAEDQNISAASSCDYNLSQFKKNESHFSEEDDMEQDQNSQEDEDDDYKVEPKQEEESDEDVPLVSIY